MQCMYRRRTASYLPKANRTFREYSTLLKPANLTLLYVFTCARPETIAKKKKKKQKKTLEDAQYKTAHSTFMFFFLFNFQFPLRDDSPANINLQAFLSLQRRTDRVQGRRMQGRRLRFRGPLVTTICRFIFAISSSPCS